MQQYFWDKPMFKYVFTLGLPFVMTFSNDLTGSWLNKDNTFNNYKVMVFILFVTYIIAEIHYFKAGKVESNKINDLTTELDQYKLNQKISDKTVMSLTTIFYDSSASINNITENLLTTGNINISEWNYKRIATGICDKLYDVICLYTKKNIDFSVNIMLYDLEAKGKNRNITMIAHKGKYPTKPSIFEEKLLMNKHRDFYAVKLFEKNKSDIQILVNKEEVNEKFLFQNENEHSEYSQYVGVPIRCNGNQMISLLQICTINDSKLGDTKEEIMDFVIKYVTPFTYFALFSHNVEKNMKASVSVIKEGEVS